MADQLEREPCSSSAGKCVQFLHKIASPVLPVIGYVFSWASKDTNVKLNEGDVLQHSPESSKDESPSRDLGLEEAIYTSTPVGDLSLQPLPEVNMDDGPSLMPIPFISKFGSDTSDDSKDGSPTSSSEDLSLDKPFLHKSPLSSLDSSPAALSSTIPALMSIAWDRRQADSVEKSKDKTFINRMVKALTKLETKYLTPEHKRKKRLFRRKQKTCSIVPKELASIYHDLAAPEPGMYILQNIIGWEKGKK